MFVFDYIIAILLPNLFYCKVDHYTPLFLPLLMKNVPQVVGKQTNHWLIKHLLNLIHKEGLLSSDLSNVVFVWISDANSGILSTLYVIPNTNTPVHYIL